MINLIRHIFGRKEPHAANRVDGSARNLTECASHTTVRTGLVYGGSQIDGLSFV
jgi:transcription termination factor Rho